MKRFEADQPINIVTDTVPWRWNRDGKTDVIGVPITYAANASGEPLTSDTRLLVLHGFGEGIESAQAAPETLARLGMHGVVGAVLPFGHEFLDPDTLERDLTAVSVEAPLAVAAHMLELFPGTGASVDAVARSQSAAALAMSTDHAPEVYRHEGYIAPFLAGNALGKTVLGRGLRLASRMTVNELQQNPLDPGIITARTEVREAASDLHRRKLLVPSFEIALAQPDLTPSLVAHAERGHTVVVAFGKYDNVFRGSEGASRLDQHDPQGYVRRIKTPHSHNSSASRGGRAQLVSVVQALR